MGVSYRKSIHVGKLFKINLSKTGGIGISTGIKGLHISKNSEGIKLSLGKDGIYYTKWFMTKKHKKEQRHEKKEKEEVKEKAEKKEEVKEKTEKAEEKKDQAKEKVNKTNAPEAVDPNTASERVPTDDETALLLYLGSKEHNIPLYALGIIILGYIIFLIFSHSALEIGIGIVLLILAGLYLQSKYNRFFFQFDRAIGHYDREKYDKAYEELSKCVSARPKNHKALILMMFTSFKLEKYQDVLKYVNDFKMLGSMLEVMYFMEGVSAAELGKYQEGIDAIEKVHSDEDDIKYSKFKVLGDCYIGLEDYKMALSWFEQLPIKAKHLDESIVSYLYGYGKALLLSGDKKKAFSELAKVYDYNADYKDVKTLLKEAKEE